VSKSCERPTLANLSSTDLAERWVYPYTDFGEGRGKLARPILRAVIGVAEQEEHFHLAECFTLNAIRPMTV
jgi:hypothetical protein